MSNYDLSDRALRESAMALEKRRMRSYASNFRAELNGRDGRIRRCDLVAARQSVERKLHNPESTLKELRAALGYD